MTKTQILRVPSEIPGPSAAKAGAQALREGKIVAFPTETVYGLAALASNPSTMTRLRDIKARPENPFSVHLGDKTQAKWYIKSMRSEMNRLIEKAWPGPVTIIAETGGALGRDDFNNSGLFEILTKNGSIGLRCPDESVTAEMLGAIDQPIVAPLMIPFDVVMLDEAGNGLFQCSFAKENHSVQGF